MSKMHLSSRRLITGIAFTIILVVIFTLAAAAQEPAKDGEPAVSGMDLAQTGSLEEEQVTGVDVQLQAGQTGNGEAGNLPGEVTAVEEIELLDQPESPDLVQLFARYSANVFVPYDDDMTYVYGGGGCRYRTGGTAWTDHTLQLPQGAEIDYLRIYFYDNDAANNASAFLFSFDDTGGYTQIATAESTGTPGWSSMGSGFFSYFVDNINQSLSLRLSYGGGTTGSLQICAVRLRYQYTSALRALPLILRDSP